MMGLKFVCALTTAFALQVIGAARPAVMCPSDPNCVCGGTVAVDLNCVIDGRTVKINLLPNTYISVKCENTTSIDYNKLPKCANLENTFQSVSFKDCPLPSTSFKDVLYNLGVSKTMSLIFQNAKNLSGYFDRHHFSGLQDLTKLLLSVNGITHLPDNLFVDVKNLTWLNIRSNSINLSEELFKPLEKLETLEISHNHMTNISSSLFSHLSFLRKLSLWQSNVTWFSKDFFSGVDVLEELDLSSNGLNELPASIFKPLKKLKKLTLFANKFSSLPRNLFKTNEELETIVILNNDVKMMELPKYLLGGLQYLRQIYIQRCGLENIPYDVFADSPMIKNISLAYNDIETLPEAVFNDQINLLELDLSHNKLKSLEHKLFSSLVRLERLNLCHNSLTEVSGFTFSSLLSLIYLNMEHNNLETISSYLFSDNKQRMSISLAYNKLDFENKQTNDNSSIQEQISPFIHTYNLKLLNLSHNEFKRTPEDWWFNGHESLDMSHNKIENLWWRRDDTIPLTESRTFNAYSKKPVRKVWLSHNPGINKCKCREIYFVSQIEIHKTEIPDSIYINCSSFVRTCILSDPFVYIIFCIIIFLLIGAVIVVTLIFIFKDPVMEWIKQNFDYFRKYNEDTTKHVTDVLVKYSEKDEEFVLKEILSVLLSRDDLKVHTYPIKSSKDNKPKHLKGFTSGANEVYTTLVVFSPNYLTSAYSDVNIKKIRGEMLHAKNTVHVFVDIGPDNSIFAFLKEQRDVRTSVLWSEANFWNTFLIMLLDRHRKKRIRFENEYDMDVREMKNSTINKANLLLNDSPSRIPDCPHFSAFDGFAHSQV